MGSACSGFKSPDAARHSAPWSTDVAYLTTASGGREGSEEDATGKLGEAGDEAVAAAVEAPALGTCSTTDAHSL